jgi:hypothetical protein
MTDTTLPDEFSVEQRNRAVALQVAANLPTPRVGFAAAQARDTTDVIRLASFILDGRDPLGDEPEHNLVLNLGGPHPMTPEEVAAMVSGIVHRERTVDLTAPLGDTEPDDSPER